MALPHAGSGEPWDVKPLGDALAAARTSALFKAENLEVIRLILPAGHVLAPHSVPGEITLQCLEGELVVEAQGQVRRLKAGQLLYLVGGEPHKVAAVQASSALLTIALLAGSSR
ncbi:MAG: cupin domain-containing protein [Pelomonas sp.]|nr:cupin domain-containing protein [Roseateles sp.]